MAQSATNTQGRHPRGQLVLPKKKPSPSKASTAILMVPENCLAGHVVCLRAFVDIAIILSGAKCKMRLDNMI